jgi:hypothetical protein
MTEVNKQQSVPGQPRAVARDVLERIAPVSTTLMGMKFCVYGAPKCLAPGTPVLMFDGTTCAVEDIVPGDKLMGPDSKPRNVVDVTNGTGPMYKVVPTKGESWVCNDEHILTLIGNLTVNKNITRDVSVKDFLKEQQDGLKYCNNWQLLRTGVDFEPKEPLHIPPYLVGLWLGDGKRGSSDIANGSQEVIDYCVNIAPKLALKCLVRPHRNIFNMEFSSAIPDVWQGRPNRNILRSFFRNRCKAGTTKKIPHEYLTASRQERLALLAGIVDADGKDTHLPYTSVNVTGEAYRDGLLFLCRSLGLAAYSSAPSTHECANGRVSTYYGINISGDLCQLPTLVKKFPERKQAKRATVTGFELEELGEGDFYGFTLEGNGRFLLGDFTVTHNTGKTRFACTFPKPLLLIGTEDGTRSVMGTEGVDFVQIETSDEFGRLVAHLRSGPKRYRTVVLDTAGGFQDIILKEVLRLETVPVQKTWGLAQREDWGVVGIQFKKRMTDLLDLSARTGLNVVVVAHERNFTEDSKASDVMSPSIGPSLTKSVASWINGACDYVCQCFIREEQRVLPPLLGDDGKPIDPDAPAEYEKTGRKEFCLRVGPHAMFQTGFRIPPHRQLPDVVVSPSYARVVEVITGKPPAPSAPPRPPGGPASPEKK